MSATDKSKGKSYIIEWVVILINTKISFVKLLCGVGKEL